MKLVNRVPLVKMACQVLKVKLDQQAPKDHRVLRDHGGQREPQVHPVHKD